MHGRAPRTEVERADASGVPAHVASAGLHRLVRATQSVSDEPNVRAVRQRFVEAAQDVAEAGCAALHVFGADGTPEEFLHVGADTSPAQTAERLPEVSGLLGLIAANPRPVRLARVEEDSRSAASPSGRPRTSSLLGVPVRSRNVVVGVLYLWDRLGGGDFTDEAEELVLALVASAGVALDNARLREESETREEWVRASAEVDQALLADDVDDLEVLRRTAGSIQQLTRADLVVVELPTTTADELEVVVASGVGAPLLTGLRCGRAGSLAVRAMDHGRAVRAEDGQRTDDQLGVVAPLLELVAVPLTGPAGPRGAVVAGRVLPLPFSDAELETAEALARRATLALELADARVSRERLDLLERRNRIAHNLRDEIVQRLYATGLSMQMVEMSLPPGDLRTRAGVAIEAVDATIDLVQTTITCLRDRPSVKSSPTP